jgi:hypothetical protein
LRSPRPSTCSIEDAADEVVRRLVEDEAIEAGRKEIAWERTQHRGTPGRRLPRRRRATDAIGDVAIAEAAVTIDTRAPTFGWRGIAPDPTLGTGRVRFAFTVSTGALARRRRGS